MRRASSASLLVALAVCGATVAQGGEPSTLTRSYRHSLPLSAGDTLRLANLAGALELVPGSGGELVVEATLHGRLADAAQTRGLLDGMRWVESRDRQGRHEWALSYPVERFSSFSYPVKGGGGWWDDSRTSFEYLGRKVTIYSRPRADAPVLYADLRILLPADARVAVRNGAGSVRGGRLRADLGIDTGSGDVEIESFAGRLGIDTGSGDVDLGEVRAACTVDTGSGDVRVTLLEGEGSVDTGSGNVEVERVVGASLGIDTGSGDVRVGGGQVGTLNVDTGSGDIRIEGVEVEVFRGDTGSGDVVLRSSLRSTRDVVVDTGSGSVRILGGANAGFDLEADQGSGDLVVGYTDAVYKRHGREIYGARRGDGRTRIRVETGSGDCVIEPHAEEPPLN